MSFKGDVIDKEKARLAIRKLFKEKPWFPLEVKSALFELFEIEDGP